MKILVRILLIVFPLLSCIQVFDKEMTISDKALSSLNNFKTKPKFDADTVILHYSGISNPVLKPVLTKLINKAAEDFKVVATSKHPTEEKFQEQIKVGLSRFTPLDLDTEDRERVCLYYEELMDIIGLQSSGGHLNNWMYGFDPTK